MSPTRAVIFVNGNLPDLEAARSLLRPGDTLLAADGGVRHLLSLGRLPSTLIGDLDSTTADERRRLEKAGVRILQFPRDKDETDLELALRHAVAAGHDEILIAAALGGRLDQSLANLSLLADPALAGLKVRLDNGVEEAFFVRSRRQVRGRPGDLVSLLPWGMPSEGVTTTGLRWPLDGETLSPCKTRGVSNEMIAKLATIKIKSGLLLCIHRRGRP